LFISKEFIAFSRLRAHVRRAVGGMRDRYGRRGQR
jgi:hypothetical protein